MNLSEKKKRKNNFLKLYRDSRVLLSWQFPKKTFIQLEKKAHELQKLTFSKLIKVQNLLDLDGSQTTFGKDIKNFQYPHSQKTAYLRKTIQKQFTLFSYFIAHSVYNSHILTIVFFFFITTTALFQLCFCTKSGCWVSAEVWKDSTYGTISPFGKGKVSSKTTGVSWSLITAIKVQKVPFSSNILVLFSFWQFLLIHYLVFQTNNFQNKQNNFFRKKTKSFVIFCIRMVLK